MDKHAKHFGAMAALGLAAASALLFAGCGGGGGGGGSSSTTSSSPTASSSTALTPPAPPAIPTFPTTTTAPVDQTQTLSNLRSLGLSLVQYSQDNDQKFPVALNAQAIQPLLMPYAHDSTIFVDPNTSVPFAWNASLSGTLQTQFPDYSAVVTFYVANPVLVDARPLVLLNGHAELVTDAQWQPLKASSHIP